ncbi:MAG TPA: ROK family protein [Isosphaeraceae bacterium]
MADKASGRPVVGVDLGGTKILAAVVHAGDEKILGRSKKPTPAKEGGAAILAAIVAAADEALAEAGVARGQIAGIGVGSPGPIDIASGEILFSANLNVRNFALGSGLSSEMGRPVIVRNDVQVGGYGEFRLGAGRGYENILAAFIGTGIGGCLVSDGKVVEGSTGNAGEVGHITIKVGGPKCGCGRRGCLEVFSSRSAIARRITKAVRKGHSTVLADKVDKKSGRLKSGELAEAVAAQDQVALKEVHRAAHYLGIGLGSLVNVLGPEIVIVGGGVTEALGAPWIDLVRASMRKAVLVDPHESIEVEAASLGDDAGVLGAALLASEKFEA